MTWIEAALPPFERLSPRRSVEAMDDPDRSRAELARALDALAASNRRLGATAAVLRSVVRRLPRPSGPVRVLDVGCGGGDVARDLDEALEAGDRRVPRRPRLFVLGDLHPTTLRISRERTEATSLSGRDRVRFRFVRLTAPTLPFADGSFDVTLSSTLLHHLERREAVRFFAEVDRVTRGVWTVLDLRRSRAAWLAVRVLAATAWRSNPLPRTDGPVSVRRAFRPGEVRELLAEAGLEGARVRRSFPFRLLVEGGPMRTALDDSRSAA